MRAGQVVFFLILFGVTGYFRERFFEHMNIILASVYRHTDEYANINATVPAIMAPFLKWSYTSLYFSKYPFTLAWTAVFYLISYLALKKMAIDKSITRYLTAAYVILLFAAGASMLIGLIINGNLKNDEYTFSRWLLGIAQSPLICLFLLASERLNKKTISYDK